MRKKLRAYCVVLCVIICLSITAYIFRENISLLYGYSIAALSYYGSRGQEVRNIQSRLKSWGYYHGKVDGIYGYQTYQAVRHFQAKNGLKVDGIAGPQTLAAIGLPTGKATTSTAGGTSTNKDLNMLAHLVHGEARGEPYTGKVAVAAVVLNRTRDSRFPNTIAGVIYQPGAFTAVSDGQINLQPDSSSINAARDALNGWDPSYGSLYYWNPATATSKWIWSRQIIVKIGKHYFGK